MNQKQKAQPHIQCCIDFTLRLLGRVFFLAASKKVVNRNIEILCQLNGILIGRLCIVSCACFGSPITISRFRNASFSQSTRRLYSLLLT
nr:MAG TPA: hypothetical protein [Caudoviricetes sp.]